SDPTVPYRLKVTNEFTEVVRQRKEKLIQQLKEKQAELKEENLRQIRQRAQERDDRQKEEKLYKPINLDGVKRNSRAFETLKKAMKVFQVKFKDGPLKDERDIQILTAKIKEIYAVLPDKEKAKWMDANLEQNQYFKVISKWLGQELAKEILFEPGNQSVQKN